MTPRGDINQGESPPPAAHIQLDPRPGTRPYADTVHAALGIELWEASAERVVLSMPVDQRSHQPFGFLHGGVSVVLAESAASIGASLAAGPDHRVFGMEINASHLRPVRSGTVRAVAEPIRIGRSTQVWEINLFDDEERRFCVSRCALAVVAAEHTRDAAA